MPVHKRKAEPEDSEDPSQNNRTIKSQLRRWNPEEDELKVGRARTRQSRLSTTVGPRLGVKAQNDTSNARPESPIEINDSSDEEEEPFASAVYDLAKVVLEELQTTSSYKVLKRRIGEVRSLLRPLGCPFRLRSPWYRSFTSISQLLPLHESLTRNPSR
jgi:hypothetical protein